MKLHRFSLRTYLPSRDSLNLTRRSYALPAFREEPWIQSHVKPGACEVRRTSQIFWMFSISPFGFFEPPNPPRIASLLPGLFLPIEPYLPSNYVLAKHATISGLHEPHFWGPKTEIEKHLNSPYSHSQNLIMVMISPLAQQRGKDIVLLHTDQKELSKAELEQMQPRKLSWGSYPLLAVRSVVRYDEDAEPDVTHSAFCGLNDPSQMVLSFSLLPPRGEENSEQTLNFWEDFLHKARELPPEEARWIFGLEMQDGWTYHIPPSVPKTHYKVIAERRTSDNHIGVFALPITTYTRLEIIQVFEYIREDTSQRAVAVTLRVATVDGKNHYWGETRLPVTVRDVPEFSLNEEMVKDINEASAVVVPSATTRTANSVPPPSL